MSQGALKQCTGTQSLNCVSSSRTEWLTDWLIGCMVTFLFAWLIDCWIDWLLDWLLDWLTDWLTDWLLSLVIPGVELCVCHGRGRPWDPQGGAGREGAPSHWNTRQGIKNRLEEPTPTSLRQTNETLLAWCRLVFASGESCLEFCNQLDSLKILDFSKLKSFEAYLKPLNSL